MIRAKLIRWSGGVAVAAGLLRGGASFTSNSSTLAIGFLYLIIDVLLLLGLVGLYSFQRKKSRWGLVGFILALCGALLLVVHDLVRMPLFIYGTAACLFAIGVSVLALHSWVARTLPRLACAFLITSTLIGIPGYLFKGLALLFVVSGILFGLGFSGAGLAIWLSKSYSSTPAPARPDQGQ